MHKYDQGIGCNNALFVLGGLIKCKDKAGLLLFDKTEIECE